MINLRIRKCKYGYVSEIQKITWYGKRYWTHFISVSGMSDVPWHFSSKENAINHTMLKINKHLQENPELCDQT